MRFERTIPQLLHESLGLWKYSLNEIPSTLDTLSQTMENVQFVDVTF